MARRPVIIGLTMTMVLSALLLMVACAPAAAPAPAAPAPAAPAAPAQPKAPAPAAAPQAPAPAPTAAPAAGPTPTAVAKLTPKRGGTVTLLGSSGITGGWDPFLNSTQGMQVNACCYLKLLQGRLTELKQKYAYEIKPYLAESWDIAPDGNSITFHLRKGVKWSPLPPLNGREVTAEDVKYSYDRLALNPKSVVRGAFINLASVEVVDKYTVKFVATAPTSLLIENAVQSPAFVIPREIVERDGNISFVTIGAGPFYLDKDIKGVGWTLKRNENFFDVPKPYVDEVKLRLITDKAAQTAAFRSGQLDVWNVSQTGALGDMQAILKSNPQTTVVRTVQGSSMAIALKADEPDKPWADKRVRVALSKALDRDTMIRIIEGEEGDWGGVIAAGYQPYALTMEEKRKVYNLQYDLAAAKQLMKEAGYPNGFKMATNYRTTSPFDYLIMASQMLKENLNVEVDMSKGGREYSDFLANGFTGNYKESIYYMISGTPTWFQVLMFEFHSKGKWPTTKINSPQVDKMVEEIFGTFDEKERVRKIKEFQYYVLNELAYWVWLPGGAQYSMRQPWIKDYEEVAIDQTPYWVGMWVAK